MWHWATMIGVGCAVVLIVEGTSSRLYHSPEPWQTYRTKVVDTLERSWMDKSDEEVVTYKSAAGLVDSARTVDADAYYGDVVTTYRYQDYVNVDGLPIPQTIIVERSPGHRCDTMHVVHARIDSMITVEQFAPGVSSIILAHADTRSIVLEFVDHLLVFGAPLTSENGELLISTIRQRLSTKPIRYASYGHFHPHYSGGLRPFVADGATILAPRASADFIAHILSAPRTVGPDRLSRMPRPPAIQTFDSSLTLSDAAMEARFVTIGMMSAHSADFTLLYLPRHRLLIQDELAWIPLEGASGEAGPRQKGLANAIDSLGLEVDTIIQGWPVKAYGRKTILKRSEL